LGLFSSDGAEDSEVKNYEFVFLFSFVLKNESKLF